MFRRALRASGRVIFVGCNKSNQQCALQAAAGGGAVRRHLGGWCQAWGFDCGPACPRGVFFFGLRVMNRFPLR